MIVSKGERIFNIVNIFIMLVIGFITLYPFWYVLVSSLSNGDAVVSGQVFFWPRGFTLSAYQEVLSMKGLWTAYANTILYVVAGTCFSVLLTVLAAYPLSKRRLRGRRLITFFFAFTMWFSAGTVPFYLNFKSLGLLDSRLGVILSFAISTFYIIVLRTGFEGVPESIEESAKIDGAGDFTILLRLYLPLCMPSVLTIMMYYAIAKWNGYFWPMVLLKEESKIPLQVLLRKLVVDLQGLADTGDFEDYSTNRETVTYATIIISVLPIICVYPYIQKYFVKGMVVGAVKG